LVGEATGATHRLGDRVKVRLVEAIPVAGALRFELLSEGRPSLRGRRRDRGAGPRTSRGEIHRGKQRAGGRKGR